MSRLLIAAALVAMVILVLALLRPNPSEAPQVRLRRLVRVEDDPPRALGDTPNSFMAQFQIEVPSGRRIWLADGPIRVDVLTDRRDWICLAPGTHSIQQGRGTISRSIWLAVPPDVKSFRLTIGFRCRTSRELGTSLLDKSGLSRRFPAISAWIIQHLSTAEYWQVCRREVPVTPSSIQLETYRRAPAQTNDPPPAHAAAPSIEL